MNRALLSSAKTEYRTPAAILTLVQTLDQIGLDPCAAHGDREHGTGARVAWHGDDHDGLTTPWIGHGLIYVNPPYGRTVRSWVRKIAAEAENGAEIIALLAARPDSAWFQTSLMPAVDALCFWRGRVTFVGAAGPAPFPSVVTYSGPRAGRFISIFELYGLTLRTNRNA